MNKLQLSDIELLDRSNIDDNKLKKLLVNSFNPNGIVFGFGIVWWYIKNDDDSIGFDKRITQSTDEDLDLAIKFAEESDKFVGWPKSLLRD